MPSTYTGSNRILKQGVGENDSTWGTIADLQYDLLDDAISGINKLSVTTGSDITLDVENGNTDQARKPILQLSGAPVNDINIIVPAVSKAYFIDARYTGTYKVTVKPSGGTGVTFQAGSKGTIYCDGVNVYPMFDSGFKTGDLKFTTGTIAAALTANPGWQLADGTNGSPDMRNKFVIGADVDTSGHATTSLSGTALQTGGSNDFTTDTAGAHTHTGATGAHQLTIAEMPSHSHKYGYVAGASGTAHDAAGTATHTLDTDTTGGDQAHSHTISSDGDHTHEVNIPPFFAVIVLYKL